MKRTHTEKAAEVLVDSASRVDWNPSLFTGHILTAPPVIQRAIIHALVHLFKVYAEHAKNPYLEWRIDQEAYKEIESVDLTEFDKPW
jgi:hypothetical protein